MLNRFRGEPSPTPHGELHRARGADRTPLDPRPSLAGESGEPEGVPSRLWKVLESALDEELRSRSERANLEGWATEMLDRVGRHVRNRMPRSSPCLEELDDIVQEIALRVLTSLHRFEGRGEGSIWPWVHTIAERGLQDAWRRHSSRRSRSVEPWDRILEGVEAPGTPLSSILDAETHQRFHRALRRMDDRTATAIRLRLESELYYRDVARALNYASADAARMAVQRGLAEVKVLLAEDESDPPGTMEPRCGP